MMLRQRLRHAWEQRFYRWIDKRAPRAKSIRLNHKNLYLFPNASGALFLLGVLVIWLLGTNYQNNLALAVSYLLISLFIVSIYHTYANLAGIQIKLVRGNSVFAGAAVEFVLELSCRHKAGSDNIELRWPGGPTQVAAVNYGEPTQIGVWAPTTQRGYFRPGRLLIQSRFPLGIIRSWTWLNLDAETLIFPIPIAADEPHAQMDDGRDEGGRAQRGGDDFNGLRDYQPGESIKHIAWKQYARDKGLFTKEYQQVLSAEKWLDWDSLNQPQEARLSALCHWALEYELRQIPYGLKLPGITLDPACGDLHKHAVLTELARFNQVKEAPDAR